MHIVSIIMPSYKSEVFISQAIESVLQQTYSHWELLIVDDCSPDQSNMVIEKYLQLDARIKFLKLEKNSGAAEARNKAIENTTGRFVAFLDADDIWLPNKLEYQVGFMLENNIAFSCTAYDMISENGEYMKTCMPPPRANYHQMLKASTVGCLTAMYDTDLLGKHFMPLIRNRQDYGLWLDLLKKTDAVYGIQQVLAQYRIVLGSISRNKFKMIKYHWILFRKHQNLPWLKALYYLTWNIYRKIRKSI